MHLYLQECTPPESEFCVARSGVVSISSLRASGALSDEMTWEEKTKLIVDSNEDFLQRAREKPITNATLVSALFDLGRDKLERPFEEYLNRFRNFLTTRIPTILFLDIKHKTELEKLVDELLPPEQRQRTLILWRSSDWVKTNFPWMSEVQSLQESPEWNGLAGWLSGSPQAKLPLYNPLVMSKMVITAMAAEWNPFHTDSFLFVDAGHACNGGPPLTQELLMPWFRKLLKVQVHGFKAEEFKQWIGDPHAQNVKVGRGGVFGGRREVLSVVSELFKVFLHHTLSEGLMGTEENLLSLLAYRVPSLVARHNLEGHCTFWNLLEREGKRMGTLDRDSLLSFRQCHRDAGWPRSILAGPDGDKMHVHSDRARQAEEISKGTAEESANKEAEKETPELQVAFSRRMEAGETSSQPNFRGQSRYTTQNGGGITVGMLVNGEREMDIFIDTLQTYEVNGLLSQIPEMFVFFNSQTEAMVERTNAFFSEYSKLYPSDTKFNVRLMGSDKNENILKPFNWMVGNATNPYFLFLEKDFKLIEPWTCVTEQLELGKTLLSENKAQVVRYRHRQRPGHPLWTYETLNMLDMNRQPNLLCTEFWMLPDPVSAYPGKFWKCDENISPTALCVSSFDCCQTNNPHLFLIDWWKKEYIPKFEEERKARAEGNPPSCCDPDDNVEFWFNWADETWRSGKWTVALLEGLFRHEDPKWGGPPPVQQGI
uniref:Uncharacterized protein n=1 Tax=Chromera velia CCMP2878 TaxID=1169474 RepID=A0A0G4F942_9ALVE|eukprot:Cvel_15808.t1-p1 / transcript=Cvel_15808.t1 / gene=Cvel_15808 / organism=Chromera_velia_CCMP2878 / gene_product=hypothetical protein / transcript_product=hypothetical protein / location=Cvel_scaffold1187:20172-24459(+) / protein_length=710 / sequence_SO=supercontig / SO=protein_coding / is_pseudo=false